MNRMWFMRGQTEAFPMCSWAPGLISLQDMCKLYLLATIDEYPVDVLAKLPLHMRKKLFMAMPVIDRLHYEGTVFVDGLEVITAVDPGALEAELNLVQGTELGTASLEIVVSDMVTRSLMNSNKVYLCDWQDTDQFTQDMAKILFLPKFSELQCYLKRYCAINFARGCFDCFLMIHPADCSSFYRYNSDFFYCVKSFDLKRCSVNRSCVGINSTSILNVESIVKPKVSSPVYLTEVDDRNLIIPSHLAKFTRYTTELFLIQRQEFQSIQFEAFIEYCKLWSQIPKELEIDCHAGILDSPIWKYFLTRHTQPDGGRVVYSYLKKFLSSVETLQLSTSLSKHNASTLNFSVLRDLVFPVIRSCAGHNMESRRLKQIKIFTTGSLEAVMELLASVQEFLYRGADRSATIFNHDDVINAPLNESACPAPLDFHHNEPYLIELLSIIVMINPFLYAKQTKEAETNSRSLLERSRDILVQQLPGLKHVAMTLLPMKKLQQASNSFPWPAAGSAEAIYTIIPTLIDFVRQPQFQSLSLTMMTPDLLDAFLTTPATHDQLLSIEGFTVWADQPHLTDKPDPGDVPSSNLKFKSLKVSSLNSVCCGKVMAAHVLRLKMLRIPVESLLSVCEDAIIEVSHVTIDLTDQSDHQSPASSLFHPINLFLRKNVHLSILELFLCEIHNLLLVNHCLEQLIESPITLHTADPVNHPTTITPLIFPRAQRRQTLKEIRLHFGMSLLSYVTGSQQGNVLQGLSAKDLNQQISEYNQPLLNLFVLIRNLGKSRVIERLVITCAANDPKVDNFHDKELLRMIVKQSGDGRVKKILLKGYSNTRTRKNLSANLEIFERIAEEVVVDS